MTTPPSTLRARVLAVTLVASIAPLAHAQSTGLPVYPGAGWVAPLAFSPDTAPHVEDPSVPAAGDWTAVSVLQGTVHPYAFAGAPGGASRIVIDGQFLFDPVVQIGLGRHFAAAADLPVLVTQAGSLGAFGRADARASGVGDARLAVRWSSRVDPSGAPATSHPHGATVALQLAGSAPTGSPAVLAGTGAWSLHPGVIVDGAVGPLRFAGQLGYLARFDRHWPAQSGGCSADAGTVPSGQADVTCLAGVPLRDGITWSVGVVLSDVPLGRVLEVYVEAYGSIDARVPFAAGTTPVEAGGGVRHRFGDLLIGLGASAGIPVGAAVPGVPAVRPMGTLAWAPVFHDNDQDGVYEPRDRCPDEAEDVDGFQDDDGCPDPDNDGDGVPDAHDRCPNVPEDRDGYRDGDGCPDPDNDRDRVPDVEDRCPDVAAGATPDERRPGCPDRDTDGDGVMDSRDRCVDIPGGPRPDPARAGCPQIDRDRDGVVDADDACPDEFAPRGTPPAMRGCPDLDRDHDGVLDAGPAGLDDRCPDSAESINGWRDHDGCFDRAPWDQLHRAVTLDSTAGSIQLEEPIRFDAHDDVDPRDDAVVDELALALVATARRPFRLHTVSLVLGPHGDEVRALARTRALAVALRAHGAPDWAFRMGAPMREADPVERRLGLVLRLDVTAAPGRAPADVPASVSADPYPAPAATPVPRHRARRRIR